MAIQSDKMRNFIKIAEKTELLEEVEILPDVPIVLENDNKPIIEDLHQVVFKLSSYRELNENQNYALGIEEGLSLAAEMINRIIEKYEQVDSDE
jgi:uncharacterized protein YlzI (FlbEa/FlbD family)